ncbi:tail fiber domain-containing protein [Agrobacterium tumefaciens]|uniref:tail fiber domain-containing protein n=1 Tax=Agrobacterium tumefaciens TaxID=358 RepID=UPI003BA3AB8B
MSNVTSLRMRVLPRFPARITADNGLTIERDGLELVLKPDFGSLMKVPSVQGAEVTYFWAWNEQHDGYSSISFQNLVANIQDVIIGENLAGLNAVASGLNRVPIFVDDEGNATTYTVSDYFQSVSGSTNADELMEELGGLAASRLPVVATRNSIGDLFIPTVLNSMEARSFSVVGDGGGAKYKRVSFADLTGFPTLSYVRSLDRFMPNGAVDVVNGGYWVIDEKEVTPQMLGAVADGVTPDTLALQASLDFGQVIKLIGTYACDAKLTRSGGACMRGFGRDRSTIRFLPGSASSGIDVTATSYSQKIVFEDFAIDVQSDLSTGKAISVSWQGLGLSEYFTTKFVAERLHIRATNGGKFDKGIYLNFVHCGYIKDCFVQNQPILTGTAEASFPMTACIYFDNDETVYNTATFRVEGCELFGAQWGAYVRDVEGFWFTGNDIQACWHGIHFHNGYRKINQYRIHGNHIGVFDYAVYLYNARQFLISNNEFSYRVGRVDLATVEHIILEQVQDGDICGNSIRGNYQSLSGSITLNGVKVFGIAGDPSTTVRVFGNGFRDMMTAMTLNANTLNFQHYGNTFLNVLTSRLTNNVGASVIQAFTAGSGSQSTPVGQNYAMWLSNTGSGALGVNRDADGVVAGWYRSGTLVGSVNVTASATTYATSSDYRLKTDIRDLENSGAFIDALKPRRFIMGGVEQDGFIAHEFAEVSRISVSGDKDAVGEDGEPIYQAMQASTSEVMANVIAELQSLRLRVAEIEEP